MSDPAIQLVDVSYRYPRTKRFVIDGLNLSVGAGEFFAVMGQNGAGKSTLCQILNGIIPNSMGGRLKGQVLIQGLDTQAATISELATRVGVVLEDPETQLFTTSVESEVAFGAENLSVSPEEIRERVHWALEVVRLSGFEQRAPTALSGGQKQRLAIAAAMAMRPSILVLDEATSQLDPLGVLEVMGVIRELNEKYGMTIVMATDQSEEIARLANRIAVLDQGKLVACGTPREIFADAALFSRCMLRAPQVSQLGNRLVAAGCPLPEFPLTIEEASRGVEALMTSSAPGAPFEAASVAPAAAPAPVAQPVIQVEDLKFNYPMQEAQAVRGVNFNIYPGEFVALIGQNGSGKTTILKNLLGLLKPTSGRVVIAGSDTRQIAVADLARHVGFVLQNPDDQLFATTVEEEIAFGPRNLGLDPEAVKERVAKAMAAVGLEGMGEEFPPALPKGERAKVVIACALALNPQAIVLDEPTTGQDYKGCHQIMQIARALHETGRTVLFVTHHMALVAEYAQRVIVLRHGQILLDAPTAVAFDQPELVRQAHVIPPQITELSQALPPSLGLPRTVLNVDQLAAPIQLRLAGHSATPPGIAA